jgi:hypothetical protein
VRAISTCHCLRSPEFSKMFHVEHSFYKVEITEIIIAGTEVDWRENADPLAIISILNQGTR